MQHLLKSNQPDPVNEMDTVSAIGLLSLQQYLHLVARDPWPIVTCCLYNTYNKYC